MSTDAPFRRQIYQRGTLLIKKCVTKPNMHLNVLHTQVFISIDIHLSLYTHTRTRLICSLVWFSSHYHSTGCQCSNTDGQLATVTHDPGYLLLP